MTELEKQLLSALKQLQQDYSLRRCLETDVMFNSPAWLSDLKTIFQ